MLDRREEVRAAVKEIIVSIKPLDDGLTDLPDDAPLFKTISGDPSPLELDSLDGLDLALSLGERFGLEGEEIDRLLTSDVDFQSLSSVSRIVEFILSVSPEQISGQTGEAPRRPGVGV